MHGHSHHPMADDRALLEPRPLDVGSGEPLRAHPDLKPPGRLVLRLGASDGAHDVGGRRVPGGTSQELRCGAKARQALRRELASAQRAFRSCWRASALAMTPADELLDARVALDLHVPVVVRLVPVLELAVGGELVEVRARDRDV